MKTICVLTILCTLTPSTGWARKVEDWPYDRLLKNADVVVIARPVSSVECKDEWNERFFDGSRFQSLETTFEVASTLKGKSPESLKLLHFRYNRETTVYEDGPGLISFLTKPRSTKVKKRGEVLGELVPLVASKSSRPEYLLFLRLRKDGRYEAISGQMDSNLSARTVNQMLPLILARIVETKTHSQQESVKPANKTPTSEPIEESINTHMSLLFKPSYRRLKLLMCESPEDAAGWKAIQAEALLLAESGGNLTTRRTSEVSVRDGKEYWAKNSSEVRTLGAELYRSAKEKDFAAATRSYKSMTRSCNACHQASVFLGGPPILNPLGKGVTD